MSSCLQPLVKWSGGKSDEIKLFEKYIPSYDTYIEPFVGGGALFFYLNSKKNIISDTHQELIALYKSIKNGDKNEIYNFMKSNDNKEDIYYNIRDKMICKNDLDIAKRFYYIRKTCYRGMSRYNKNGKFNIPYGRYKNYNFENLLDNRYEDILKNTTIYNESYKYIFDNYNDENNFVFLDPPYDSEFTDYGYCKFEKKDHITLSEYFKTTKNKCLMIIGKTEFISNLYKDYIVDEYKKKYRFKIHSNRVGDEINTTHLIIKNY